jgi:PIN domain nuclease of toxin-antitoxin system
LIYLDTHVVVWLYAGQVKKLSERAIDLINNNEILISPVVRLELRYLCEIQRITDEATQIVSDLSARIGLKICDKNFNTIISNTLNHSWTRDPFDRIIVAHADVNHNILITKDQNILTNYKKAVW